MPSPRARSRWLVPAMVFAVLAVAVLAYWDEERESEAALDDFAHEQATLARSVGEDLRFRLSSGGTESEALRGVGATELPNELLVLVQRPGAAPLSTTGGREIRSATVEQGLASGSARVQLSREEARALGLPERIAMAGLSIIDAGPRGKWGVAVVATARRERDRDRRARWRLILAISIATGLTVAFGGFALSNQRQELHLAHELAVAELARQRDERLERVNQAATMLTLASGMAHELSTPLGVISGRAEQLLPRVQGDERATRSAQAILEQSERIRDIMRGFLGLARGGSPALQDLAPADVVKAAMALVEHRFTKAGVSLTTHVAAALPLIRGEPRLLEHALINLLLNACDASPRNGKVDIRVDAPGSSVEFAVVDGGAGIASGDAARVTEPFFTTKSAGTGLGLAITNEIVKTHRGALQVGPASMGGTRASFSIPVAGKESHVVA